MKESAGPLRNILVVFGPSVLQEGPWFSRRIPKLEPLIQRLSLEPMLSLSFMRHVESVFPIKTAYGSELFRPFRDIPVLAKSFLCAFRSLRSSHLNFPSPSSLWHEIRVSYWRVILQKRRIHAIVGTNLTKEQMLAAKGLNVPTIEVMHGRLKEDWYANFWSDLAPTHLACWPSTNTEFLSKLGVQAVQIPFPWGGRSASRIHPRPDSELLVALSWGSSESVDGLGAVPEALATAIDLAQRSFRSVRLRLHPVFPKSKRAQLRRCLRQKFPDAELEKGARGLLEVLPKCDAIMMHRSTCWMETLVLGVPTIITDRVHYLEAVEFSVEMGLSTPIQYWNESGLESEFLGTSAPSGDKLPINDWDRLITLLTE